MFKCGVCGYIHEGSAAPVNCPKCGAPQEKFSQLTEEAANLVEKSRVTNDIHVQMLAVLENVIALAEEGREEDLDPGCNKVFDAIKNSAIEYRQSIKAEIQGHMSKGKWG
ncbi:rubredoxin [Heliorestis acidaminivorans]|uniref:Rubredoxin n=1 Tax=Heliorestis acidaminivorans TaxID=553427 RepID=A0A6I0EWF1_9FIRM|nr:rubredoxin [Heliorestis acidaminivorans]KAB2952385.1 rubredoxin [Heliorestis acidaminivorans]